VRCSSKCPSLLNHFVFTSAQIRSYEIFTGSLQMIRALRNTDEHCYRSSTLLRLYETNGVVCRLSVLRCSERSIYYTLVLSNTTIINYRTKTKTNTKTNTNTTANKRKTKTEFCWSETGLVIRPKSQTTSLHKVIALCSILHQMHTI